jgi:hypothetical protein
VKKYLLWGAVSFNKVINSDSKAKFIDRNANSGNLIIGHAVQNHLGNLHDEIEFRDDFDPRMVNKKYDALIIPAANYIREKFSIKPQAELLEKIEIPVVCIGLGAQAPSLSEKVSINPDILKFLKVLSGKSCTIGVRGSYTAELLFASGIKNVDVIGCPSNFLNGKQDFKIDKNPLPENFRSAYYLNEHPDAMCLFDLALKSGSDLITQHKNEIVCLKDDEINGFVNSRYYELMYSKSKFTTTEIIEYINYRIRVFYEINAWQNALSNIDFAFGMRFHGNMMALQQRIPALWVTHDSRTIELASFLQLPSISPDEVKTIKNLQQLYEIADYSKYNQIYPQLFENYVDFLDKNGIDHILKKARKY